MSRRGSRHRRAGRLARARSGPACSSGPLEATLITGGKSNLTYTVTDGIDRGHRPAPAARARARHGARHVARAPRHHGTRAHRRPRARDVRPVRGRRGHRCAVLRHGTGQRHAVQPGHPAGGARRRPHPRHHRADDRHARRAARGRPRRRRPGRLRPSRRLPGTSGPALEEAARRLAQPRDRRHGRAHRPARGRHPDRRRRHDRARRLPARQPARRRRRRHRSTRCSTGR